MNCFLVRFENGKYSFYLYWNETGRQTHSRERDRNKRNWSMISINGSMAYNQIPIPTMLSILFEFLFTHSDPLKNGSFIARYSESLKKIQRQLIHNSYILTLSHWIIGRIGDFFFFWQIFKSRMTHTIEF